MTMTAIHRMSRGCWCHFPPGLQYGRGAVEAHLLWRRLTGSDFIKVMNESTYQVDGPPICTAAALRDHRAGAVNKARMRDQLDLLRRIVDRVRGRYPVVASIVNPFGHLRANIGDSRLAEILAEDRVAAGTGFMTMADSLGSFARDCIVKAGADAVFFASQGGEANRFDNATFEAAIGRPDRHVLAAARAAGPTILHISGADIGLSRYARHEADAVHWDAAHNAPPGDLWPGAIRMPGLDLEGALATGDRKALNTEARQIRALAGPGHQVMTPARSVPLTLPLTRLRAALVAGTPTGATLPNPLDSAAWQALRLLASRRNRLRHA